MQGPVKMSIQNQTKILQTVGETKLRTVTIAIISITAMCLNAQISERLSIRPRCKRYVFGLIQFKVKRLSFNHFIISPMAPRLRCLAWPQLLQCTISAVSSAYVYTINLYTIYIHKEEGQSQDDTLRHAKRDTNYIALTISDLNTLCTFGKVVLENI